MQKWQQTENRPTENICFPFRELKVRFPWKLSVFLSLHPHQPPGTLLNLRRKQQSRGNGVFLADSPGHGFLLFHNFWLVWVARGQCDVYSYKDCVLPGLYERASERASERKVWRTRALLMMFWREGFWDPSRGQHGALYGFRSLLSPSLFIITAVLYIQKKKTSCHNPRAPYWINGVQCWILQYSEDQWWCPSIIL